MQFRSVFLTFLLVFAFLPQNTAFASSPAPTDSASENYFANFAQQHRLQLILISLAAAVVVAIICWDRLEKNQADLRRQEARKKSDELRSKEQYKPGENPAIASLKKIQTNPQDAADISEQLKKSKNNNSW